MWFKEAPFKWKTSKDSAWKREWGQSMGLPFGNRSGRAVFNRSMEKNGVEVLADAGLAGKVSNQTARSIDVLCLDFVVAQPV